MSERVRGPISWRWRKGFWDRLVTTKFKGNKPAQIPVPSGEQRELQAVPLDTKYPGVPISNILVADHVPEDEAAGLKKAFVQVQVKLGSIISPMQPGLPSVSDDPVEALEEAYTESYRKLFSAPELPSELHGPNKPTLGAMAVSGPFACYLERTADGNFEWDLLGMSEYEYHSGLQRLGVRVSFEVDESARALRATKIESALGVHTPEAPEWPTAKRLALCAASTHLSMVRHFDWVHLACGGPLAIATRNRLPQDHPLCRLLWPHTYGTQYSNDIVTVPQMGEAGDFTAIFSLTHAGMCELFAKSYTDYRISVIDPTRDAERRGILNAGFDTPSQSNLQELFDVLHAHAARYVAAHYMTDEEIRKDGDLKGWLDELDRLIPNGIGELMPGDATRAIVARLIAGFIYLTSVQHEVLGTGLWNYQLWTDRIPVRIYLDGRREPLDVFQRLVSANFNLNVNRAQLMQDFSYLALDAKGEELFAQFLAELQALDAKLKAEPRQLWRILPSILEANMNA